MESDTNLVASVAGGVDHRGIGPYENDPESSHWCAVADHPV